MDRKRIVIVGGGFAGLEAAKSLANKQLRVVLIDRKNHHTFQPLLYQVASTVLSPGQIAAPLRHILRRARNIEVVLGEVTGFDLESRTVGLADGGSLPYDYLIVAAGARHSYFGHDEWESEAPGLKTIEDAIEIRRRILMAFEEAEKEAFQTGNHEPLNFAIIGAGPTGVELAGAIADIARRVVADEYRSIDTTKARVMLFEAANKVLGTYPEELSARARRQLEELGVEVHTGKPVTDIQPGRLKVGEEWVPVRVALWASGVAASTLGRLLSSEIDRSGRVQIQPDLSLRERPEAFVIGDMASLKDARGQVVPGLGSAAVQMGAFAARNVLADLHGRARGNFVYHDKGTMATIGRNRAVALIGRWQFSGLVAWLLWGLVHIVLLIGFRNRLSVMWEWVWAYVTGQGSARLITGPTDEGPSGLAVKEPENVSMR